jgi:tetratricopeptide (TPR) repeat protein
MVESHRSEYDTAFERAATRARQRLISVLREADEAVELLVELLHAPAAQRKELVRTDDRFQRLKICELLESELRDLWSDDPALVVELAELAVQIAERLDPERYGEKLVEDARASAWAHLGNSYRVTSDLRKAEEALLIAVEHYHRAGDDAYTEAEILSFMASLRNSQGRFNEASDLLDRAIAIYKDGKDPHLEGRALILKGMAFGYDGRFKKAIRLIRNGLSKINFSEEPRLMVAAHHNLIWYLNESGGHKEAQRALRKCRKLYLELGDRMHLVRLRWLEGKIARELGRLAEAQEALREARDAFVERGIGFDAALVSLDLAMVYALRGESREVKRLAAEMVPIFESRDVHQEAIAALLIFKEAAEAERISLGLLDRIAAYLERARRNPEMRFEPEG